MQEAYDHLAGELVASRPDLLVAVSLPAALALKKANQSVPIIFLGVSDPVASGLVSNVSRPGGNITGLAGLTAETYIKRVAILRDLVPRLTRLALIADLNVPVQ